MSASEHLGPQFYDHERLGSLKAGDYAGHIHEGLAPMEAWQSKFGGTGEARHYDEGRSPTTEVSILRQDIGKRGVQHPIEAVDYGSHVSIKDGHHRAVAAYLEGKGAPVEVITPEEHTKRLYNRRWRP